MSFLARKSSNTHFKKVNRSSIFVWLKTRFAQKRSRELPTRVKAAKPETKIYKRKFALVKKISPKVIRFSIVAISFLILSMIILLFTSIIRDPYYALKEITIIGNNTLTDNAILIGVDKNIGKSIFLVSTSEIEDTIKKIYFNLDTIKATKIFPDKIFINITEKDAKIILINVNGAYMIDEDAKVISVIFQKNINYNDNRLALASGFADENSALVKDVFLNKFIEDNKLSLLPIEEQQAKITAGFNFDLIPTLDKLTVFNKLKDEIKNEIDSLTGEILRSVQNSEFSYLPNIILLNNKTYNLDEVIDKKRLELTLELLKYFSNPESGPTIIGHIEWQGEMLVNIKLSNGTKIIFGVLKKPSFQLEDYEIITRYMIDNQKKYTQIDLSSTKISVK